MSNHATDLSRKALVERLSGLVPGGVRTNVDLSLMSRWRIGGVAAVVIEPANSDQAVAVMQLMRGRQEPLVIVGDTSNILFSSEGFGGVIMKFGENMSRWAIDGTTVCAQAGASVPALVRAAAHAGLGGITHAAGIPGTIGGLVVMNGGTRRRGIGEHVVRAVIADDLGNVVTLGGSELGFAYRTSNLQSRRVAVLEVELELEPGDSAGMLAEIDAVLAERAAKFPLDLPNCGSTFVSNPGLYSTLGPPGRAIEEAGLRGMKRGGAQISELHANFLVNHGSATDVDVLWLIALVRHSVAARTGFLMDCEVRHLAPTGVLQPAHMAAVSRWPTRSSLKES